MTTTESLQHSSTLAAFMAEGGADALAAYWLLPAVSIAATVVLFAAWRWWRHLRAVRSLRGMSRFQKDIDGWLWEYRAYDGCLACPEFARCLGLPDDTPQPFASALRKYVHRSDRDRILHATTRVAEGHRSVDLAVRVRAHTGEFRWLHWQGAVKDVDEAGQVLSVAGICRDITLENTVEFQARLARQVMDSASEAVVVIDNSFRIVSVNASFTTVSGYREEDVMGRPAGFLCHPDRHDIFDHEVRPALEAKGVWEGEQWKSRSDGELYLARIRINRIHESNGESAHFICIFSDVTQSKQAEKRLEFLSSHDALTGVYNRNALLEQLTRIMEHADFLSTSAAVIYLDLDNFKQINDSLGQSAGDEVLRAVARRIASVLRSEDVVARAGGDEFVIVLDRVRSREDAALVAGKLADAFRLDLQVQGTDIIVTPSIGISLYPQDASDAEELVAFADLAMVQSKKHKRATFAFYDGAMSRQAKDELHRENQLRHAEDNDEFRIHYQPIMDVSTNHVCGVEALIRWQNPEAGLLMPADFIYLAEDRGLISGIGRWVLRKACGEIARLNQRATQPVQVSINVSSSQLQDPRFVDDVEQALEETGLGARLLRLELTESVIMDGSREVLHILHSLRALGVALALDDFGTGYSSLSYLRRFPISHLKIDKSFVRDVPRDADAASIITTIIALGHAMSMGLTAEGVETPAQSHFLERQGCTEQQGFHFSRPQDITEIARLLDFHKPSAPGGIATLNS